MARARIEFEDKEDGSVEMTYICEGQPIPLIGAPMCAFALAKRGLTKRETEIYNFPGGFQFKVEENEKDQG